MRMYNFLITIAPDFYKTLSLLIHAKNNSEGKIRYEAIQ